MSGKYDYLHTKNITRDTIYPPFLNMIYHAQDEVNFQIRFTHVSEPFEGKEEPHKHDFDQIFLFVPCNPDLNDYDAESHFYLGDEGEKVVITETSSLYVPKEMTHCPIKHIRVGTPFFFVNIPITGEYSAIIDGNKQAIPVTDPTLTKHIMKDKW